MLAVYAIVNMFVCLSACPSVALVDCVEMAKCIVKQLMHTHSTWQQWHILTCRCIEYLISLFNSLCIYIKQVN